MALIINEAHHILRVVSGKESNWSVDLIKSLTNLSETSIILVGTYDLLSLLVDLNLKSTDQINQRTRIVDFPRYRSEVTSEVNIFGKTAKKLLQNMPLEQKAEDLINKQDWKYFYKNSLGCIGTLKLWLMDAYALALDSDAKTLTREHLEEAKFSGYRLDGMYQSIEEGERKMKEVQSGGDIDSKLVYAKSEDESQDNSEKSNTTKDSTKPFNRSPKRDAVM
ncbi:TniB family NTP-binding protein [Desulfosporosinus sp. FKB]|uniref:TniB family NTP-binding protein n=1 Tax=Desulfosporosinus sp. FKB TaxID=1969835 RepID=UPI000B4A2244|nr:TniB family NTP-binding protein [Desulfosporosinus sp. FKB]